MASVSHWRGAVVLLVIGCIAGCAGGQATTGDIVGGVYQEGGPISLDGTAPPRVALPGAVTATAKDGSSMYGVRTAATARSPCTSPRAPTR
jgi:hypothetical protein